MIECYKQRSVAHPYRSLKDSNAESNVECGGPAQVVSEGNSICNRARDHFCDILANSVSKFCPCHKKKLLEDKLKRF